MEKPKKQQAWDKEGHPHFWEASKYAQQGEQTVMLATGLEPVEMSPFPNTDFIEDENVTTNSGETAVLRFAWQKSLTNHSATQEVKSVFQTPAPRSVDSRHSPKKQHFKKAAVTTDTAIATSSRRKTFNTTYTQRCAMQSQQHQEEN